MASLNTLRTKFGLVLSIVIGLALLAFILSLKTEMGFAGNDPRVGVIDGNKINYSEYYKEYENVKAQSGQQDGTEQQAAMLANATWQTLIGKYVLIPGFDRMGLRMSDAERVSLLGGAHYSQVLYNNFADQRTGVYNAGAVNEFLARAEGDAQLQQIWNNLNEQLRMERLSGKYLGLIKGGTNINSLEVTQGVDAANKTFSGKWIGKKYTDVADSLIQVSSGDIKTYYNDHKEMFRQVPSRTLSYVVFDVAATDDDMLALEKTATDVGVEFAATDQIRQFVRNNRNGRVADNYVGAAQLTDDEATALTAGRMYGPLLKNNEWTMSRVLDSKMAPDSLGIRHIVLPYTEEALADSLLTALRGGADFAQTATLYSVYEATAAQGGEVGVMPFSGFTGEFVTALADARRGDIVKIVSGDVIQLMQIYRADKPSMHMQLATITYPVVASAATIRNIHGQAGDFALAAKGSMEAFNNAATEAAVTPRVATLSQGERTIRGLEDSREVARWVYGAKKGEMSQIFTVGGDYVIAVLTGIDDSEYISVEQAATQIRAQLLRDKKYDYIVAQLAGQTLDEQAASLGSEVAAFDNVNFGAFYINGPGVEPRLIGAIASTAQTGAVSAPVKGFSGVYVFRVDDIQVAENQTAEGEKVRAQAVAENMTQQVSIQAIQQMAKIEDLRGEYF